MLSFSLYHSRRAFLLGCAAMLASAAGGTADAQRITLTASKRKMRLAAELYLLNETLLTEAAVLKLGWKPEEARDILQAAMERVNKDIDLLFNGEPEADLDKEHSVAIQFVLRDLQEKWLIYGEDLTSLASHEDISTDELLKVRRDSQAFREKMKELIDTIYDVYGEAMFSVEKLRAVRLLTHERTHLEKMKEELVFAAVLPEEKADHVERVQELADVFRQTMDVLIRNGAMFGVAPPPSPEAQAALEAVEENWKPKADLIGDIAANGNVTVDEIAEFFSASEVIATELDIAIDAYYAAVEAG